MNKLTPSNNNNPKRHNLFTHFLNFIATYKYPPIPSGSMRATHCLFKMNLTHRQVKYLWAYIKNLSRKMWVTNPLRLRRTGQDKRFSDLGHSFVWLRSAISNPYYIAKTKLCWAPHHVDYENSENLGFFKLFLLYSILRKKDWHILYQGCKRYSYEQFEVKVFSKRNSFQTQLFLLRR